MKALFPYSTASRKRAAKDFFIAFCKRKSWNPEIIVERSRLPDLIARRREIAREMLAAGFAPTEIAVPLKRNRNTVYQALGLRPHQRNQGLSA